MSNSAKSSNQQTDNSHNVEVRLTKIDKHKAKFILTMKLLKLTLISINWCL